MVCEVFNDYEGDAGFTGGWRRKPKPKVLFVDPGIPDITKMGPSIALNTWFVAHMS